jgi:hypothetical protein
MITAHNKAIYKHLHRCMLLSKEKRDRKRESRVGFRIRRKKSNKWGRPGEEKLRRKSEEIDITGTTTVGAYQ